MLSKTHKLTEAITTAIGPLFREEPDYTTIQQAMGLVIARIAMATPKLRHEHDELEVVYIYAKKALIEFLKLEAEQIAKKALVDKGIGGFIEFCGEEDKQIEQAHLKTYRESEEDAQARENQIEGH